MQTRVSPVFQFCVLVSAPWRAQCTSRPSPAQPRFRSSEHCSEEFARGTLPGAVNIRAGEAEAANDDGRLPKKDKGTRVVVFAGSPDGASGGRRGRAQGLLEQQLLRWHVPGSVGHGGQIRLRVAARADLPAIEALIAESARALSAGYYTPAQVESLLRFVFGADTQLIDDETYFLIEAEGGPVAAGGWSRRRTLFGGDRMKATLDPLLDPEHEPARIRAFFVHPGYARHGLGRRLFEASRSGALAAGFRDLTLVATLPGEPLYRALGFSVVERFQLQLPDGVEVPVVRMIRGVQA
jgi:GNAT superfamily N-acetyltransferase/rhodanese-related sulfurtransferase